MEFGDLALRLGLALGLGFIIGLERGWKERGESEGQRTAGLRTFTLIGLLGGIFGALSLGGDRLLLSVGFATTGLCLAAFMWREGQRDDDLSVTSLIAAMLTFLLGAMALLGDMAVTAGAGIAAALLLAMKAQLHGFMKRITWAELRSGLLLGAMTFIALPLLPDRFVDPWQSINPHELWLMTVLIAVLSFVGYAAVKFAGPERGLMLAAALGGLFASTAVTISLARLLPAHNSRLRLIAGGILASGAVMMVRVLIVAGLMNFELARQLAPALLSAAAISAVFAVILALLRGKRAEAPKAAPVHKNPFLMSEVLRFGAILAVVMLAATFALRYIGDRGLLTVAALSGLADVDALNLSVARLGTVTETGVNAILLAVGVNTLAKTTYAGIAGGRRLGLLLLILNIPVLAVAAAMRYLLV